MSVSSRAGEYDSDDDIPTAERKEQAVDVERAVEEVRISPLISPSPFPFVSPSLLFSVPFSLPLQLSFTHPPSL